MLLNCGVGEDKIFESPFDCKEIQPIHPKQNHTWIFIGRTDAEAETPILWPPDVKNYFLENTLMLERLKAGGEGDNRGWDGWMASLTQQTWFWASSGSWWWTGKPGVLSMGLQRVRQNWVTELNWTEFIHSEKLLWQYWLTVQKKKNLTSLHWYESFCGKPPYPTSNCHH